jgi:hypothetical protein
MLKWILLSIFSLPLAQAKAPASYSQIRMELMSFTQKDLLNSLTTFVRESSPSRMVGQPGHEKAQAWLKKTILENDPKNTGSLREVSFSPDIEEAKAFYQKDFDEKVEGKISPANPDYKKWLTFTSYMKGHAEKLRSTQGVNLIWEKVGKDPSKVLVVTAHYDTISHDPKTLLIADKAAMPGANFNASGVSIALGMIKALAKMDLNYSVQITFLDWQGIGFLGSYHYARELKSSGKAILGVMNLEMLGQDTSFFDKTKKTGNMCVYYRPQDESFIQILQKHGPKITDKITFEAKPQGFENSDNFRFSEQGILSGTFSQNWEEDFNPKFFQSPQDTPETLNHQTLFSAFQYLTGALMATLGDVTK